MPATIHAFVDGDYLRHIAADAGLSHCADPGRLVREVAATPMVAGWAGGNILGGHYRVSRITYYDAEPAGDALLDNQAKQRLARRKPYWDAIELQDDTHLGFGVARQRRKRGLEQKGVDTLIAVDMLVGAFTKVYDLAILVAGDSDFVPVVDEVRRRGATIVVVALQNGAESLRRAADRFVRIAKESDRRPDRFGPPDSVFLHTMVGDFDLDLATKPAAS